MKMLRNVAVVALIVIGAGIFYVGSDSHLIRSAGLLLAMTGVWLSRQFQRLSSNALPRNVRSPEKGKGTGAIGPLSGEKTGPGLLAWAAGGGGIAIVLVANYFVVLDAQQGHHQAWPIYFAYASFFICMVGIGYFISKVM